MAFWALGLGRCRFKRRVILDRLERRGEVWNCKGLGGKEGLMRVKWVCVCLERKGEDKRERQRERES